MNPLPETKTYSNRELFSSAYERLLPVFGAAEAEGIARYLLEGLFGMTRTYVAEDSMIQVGGPGKLLLDNALSRVLTEEPVQYVVGHAWFYGRRFSVNKHVLIPRQETEELIHWILDEHASNVSWKVLDIGSGSGCIPVTLKAERPDFVVESWDVSEAALSVAGENAQQLDTVVDFRQVDVLNASMTPNSFDLVVSNPPYVRESEKKLMNRNVLDHEPALALFVDDNRPLIFYDKITELAVTGLKTSGWLYFEINEALGKQTVELLSRHGFSNIVLKKDLNGKDRMVRGQRS